MLLVFVDYYDNTKLVFPFLFLLQKFYANLCFNKKCIMMETKGKEKDMFLDGLDTLDQKIIKLLMKNARMSYSEIGEKVGISRVAVKMRIQALEKKGVIEEYTTIINPQKISGVVSCYFELEVSHETLQEVIRRLKENEKITQVYRVTGENKLHIHAVTASNEELDRLIQEDMDTLPGILHMSCSIILSRIKDIKGLRL